MKYTKKYPIHPKPKKQFSGASIFAYGGKVPPGDDEAKIVAKYNKTVPGLKEQQEKYKKWAAKYFKTPPTELQLAIDKIESDEYDASEYLRKSQEGRSSQSTKENPQGLATGQSEAMVGLDDPILNFILLAPLASQLGKIAINNAYRLNPWAFKPNPDALYRGLGKEGVEDALQSGVFRPKQNVQSKITKGVDLSKKFDKTYYSPDFKAAETYSEGFIVEVPKNVSNFGKRYPGKNWSQATVEQISIDKGKILKKDWLMGYKPISKFADGGPKTKTYTNKAEYDKALQAYNDSLYYSNFFDSEIKDFQNNSRGLSVDHFNDIARRMNEIALDDGIDVSRQYYYPIGTNTSNAPYSAYLNYLKPPTVKPIYGKQAKGTLEQEVKPTMVQGTMESEPKPINQLMMPSGSYMQKDDFIKKYGEKPWMKATGQKFAFGGFKYPNGGSFYDSSNINTSKPQVNKDGTTTTTPNPTGGYSPNYGGYAAAAAGAIPSVVNTWNDPNLTTTGKLQDTSTTVGRTAATTTFPVLGAAFGLQDMGTQIAADNSGGKYVTNKDTGKQEAVLDTKDQIGTNMLTDTGSTTGKNWSNIVTGKGTSQDWWSAIMGTILPGTEYIVNNAYAVKNEGSANQEQYNAEQAAKTNYLKNQKSQNFSAFGGYKNKFPYGGHVNEFNLAQMAYGGNMKSEVTGKSYLKDQVSDFTSNTFNKHETGGVAVDSQNEVEAGEIVYKDYVFSDRLKDAKGNSFAARAKKLIDQIK